MEDENNKAKLEKLYGLLKSAQQAIATLKTENDRLKLENATLKAQLQSEDKNNAVKNSNKQTSTETILPLQTSKPPVSSYLNSGSTSTVNLLHGADGLVPACSGAPDAASYVVDTSGNSILEHQKPNFSTKASAKRRSIQGSDALPTSYHEELHGFEPVHKAQKLFLLLDPNNYRTVAKAIIDLPLAVIRKSFLAHVLGVINNSDSRKEWLSMRKQSVGANENSMLTPEVPLQAKKDVNLIIKLICAIGGCGSVGYPVATEMLNRLLNHLIASNRNQYHFPWMSFFFGDTLGVWHHLMNWQSFCGSIHLPSENNSHVADTNLKGNSEDKSVVENTTDPCADTNEMQSNHSEVSDDLDAVQPGAMGTFCQKTSATVIEDTLFTREFENFIVMLILIQSSCLMESSQVLHENLQQLLYCVNIGSSSGVLLALVNCRPSIVQLMGQDLFYQMLLTWSVRIEDFEDSLKVAQGDTHVVPNQLAVVKTAFIIEWMLQSCNRCKKVIASEIENVSKQKISEATRKASTGYDQSLSFCDRFGLSYSIVWQRYGLVTILQHMFTASSTQILPAKLEEFVEPFEVVSRFLCDLTSFDLKHSNAQLHSLLHKDDMKVYGTEEELIAPLQQYWATCFANNVSSVEIQSFLSNIMDLVVKPCFWFFDSQARGWRGGSTGDGIQLFVSFQTRVGIMQDHLRNLSNIMTASSITSIESVRDSRNSLVFILNEYSRYCTHDTKYFEQTIQSIQQSNAAVGQYLKEKNNSFHNQNGSSCTNDKQILQICRKLHKIALETTAYIGLSMVENLIFAIACTVTGLIRHLLQDESTYTAEWNSVLNHCRSVLLLTSGICGNSTNSSVVDLLERVKLRLGKALVQSFAVTPTNDFGAQMSSSDGVLFPAFVINLDKRPDRWRRISAMAERSRINLIRVSAVDGTTIQLTDGIAEDHIKLQHLNIPESDVASTWNSSLNSKFDSGCATDPAVSLTISEKACAASHLKIWRCIESFRSSISSKESIDKSHWCSPRCLLGIRDVLAMNISLPGQLDQKDHVTKVPDDDLDCYLILEDDADIKSYAEMKFRCEILRMIRKAALTDWDIIYLGGVIPSKSSTFKGSSLKGGYFMKVNYIWMMHSYLIKGSAITKILASLPIIGPIDNFLGTLIFNGVLNAYALGDFIVDQHGGRMTDRLADTNVVRSAISSTTTVSGYRQMLDKRKLQIDNRVLKKEDNVHQSKRSRNELS